MNLEWFTSREFTTVSVIAFLVVVVLICYSSIRQLLAGRRYISELKSCVVEIAGVIRTVDPGLKAPDRKQFSDALPETLKQVSASAREEFVAGLITFSSQLSKDRSNLLLSHVRLSEVFNAQLPSRILGLKSAISLSQRFVQFGLTASVGFITLALISMSEGAEPEAIISTISGKFAFTFVGLLGSFVLQIYSSKIDLSARNEFTEFEILLDEKLNIQSAGVSAEILALIEAQKIAADNVNSLVSEWACEAKTFYAATNSLERSANRLSKTLAATESKVIVAGDVVKETLESVSTEGQIKIKSILDEARNTVEESSNMVANKMGDVLNRTTETVVNSSTAITNVINAWGEIPSKAIEKASADALVVANTFRQTVEGAGNSFKGNVDRAGSQFADLFIEENDPAPNIPISTFFENQLKEISKNFGSEIRKSCTKMEESNLEIQKGWTEFFGIKGEGVVVGDVLFNNYSDVINTTMDTAKAINGLHLRMQKENSTYHELLGPALVELQSKIVSLNDRLVALANRGQ